MSFLDKIKSLVSGKAGVVKEKVETVTAQKYEVHPTDPTDFANPDEFPEAEEVK